MNAPSSLRLVRGSSGFAALTALLFAACVSNLFGGAATYSRENLKDTSSTQGDTAVADRVQQYQTALDYLNNTQAQLQANSDPDRAHHKAKALSAIASAIAEVRLAMQTAKNDGAALPKPTHSPAPSTAKGTRG